MNARSTTDYDVVIVGGGMVGSMLAAALSETHPAGTSLRVAVLEASAAEPFTPGTQPPYDIRVSALSIATQRLFENVGAWQGVMDRRACPYREMLVWDGEADGRTHFKAEDINAPELGHIVENRVIQLALQDCLQVADNIDYLCPANLVGMSQTPVSIECDLGTDHPPITTRLLIGADGARSTVRELAGIAMDRQAYPQHALVATIDTEKPQQDITWQRFEPTGPQAMLPLCGNRASMVWYHTAEDVKRLRELSDDEFLRAMEGAFPSELGSIEKIHERASFPIAKAHAMNYIGERIALIGDAAHTVHPLAGQGVNLGMLDAGALAQLISEAATAGDDVGNRRLLRRYERWRRGENTVMISVLDGFYHAFKPQPEPVKHMRSAALNVADRAGPLKKFVMRYAMGTAGQLPVLARHSVSSDALTC